MSSLPFPLEWNVVSSRLFLVVCVTLVADRLDPECLPLPDSPAGTAGDSDELVSWHASLILP